MKALLKTRCGCTRLMDIPYKMPEIEVHCTLDLSTRPWIQENVYNPSHINWQTRRFRLKRMIFEDIGLYEECN